MPFATLTAGGQTAEIRYGYGVLNRIQSMSSKLLPPARLAEAARSGDTGNIVATLSDTEIAGMLVGQLENQVEIVRLVLISVMDESGKVLYTKGKTDPVEFVDCELAPALGAEIAAHLMGAMKTEGASPNSTSEPSSA